MTQLLVTTGPESSGKTTLAEQLSAALKAPLVSEASRDYLSALYRRQPGYQYQPEDLLHIARLQHEREQRALAQQPTHLVCDTDLLVILIWSEVKYGKVDAALLRLFEQTLAATPRTYLLCTPDMPWQPDPLRENPLDRDLLYGRYLNKLKETGSPYTLLAGDKQARLRHMEQFLAAKPR